MRKIERRIRRLEKQQRSSLAERQEAKIAEALAKLKEDLEYVRVSYVQSRHCFLEKNLWLWNHETCG